MIKFLLLTFLTPALWAQAQRDSISFSYLDDFRSAKMGQSFDFMAGAPPITLSEQTKIFPSISLRNTELDDFWGKSAYFSKSSLGAVVRYGINEHWRLSLINSVSSKGAGAKAFNFSRKVYLNGVYLANYCPKGADRYCYSFGVVWNNGSSFSPAIPVFGFRYMSEDKRLSFNLSFPNSNIVYYMSKKAEVGFQVEYSVDMYELPVDNSFLYNSQSHYFEMARLLMGPFLNFGLTENIFINFNSGISLMNKKQFNDRKGNSIEASRVYKQTAWYLKTGIGLRF